MDSRYDRQDLFVIDLRFANGVIARVLAVYGLVEQPLPVLGLGIYGCGGTAVNGAVVLDKIEGKPVMKLQLGREGGRGREV